MEKILKAILYWFLFLLTLNTIGTYFPNLNGFALFVVVFLITVFWAGLLLSILKNWIYIIVWIIFIQLFIFLINLNNDIETKNYIISKIEEVKNKVMWEIDNNILN